MYCKMQCSLRFYANNPDKDNWYNLGPRNSEIKIGVKNSMKYCDDNGIWYANEFN